jgi:DNA-binding response OmpR family regulator
LERSGFVVEVAGNGEDALRLVGSFHPDLVVLDVLMPRMDGREMLRRLRQAGNWVPVILLTQVGGSTERAMAIEEGADDGPWPFDPYELAARIRAVQKVGDRVVGAAQRLASGNLVLIAPAAGVAGPAANPTGGHPRNA